MRWSIPRAMFAVVMLVMCFVPLAGASTQEPDFEAALNAAEHGDAVAQYNLGVMYERGRGVTQDYGKAVTWYRKAAEQGDPDAQFNLAAMYEQGHGVAKDYGKARAWYQKSASQGDAFAQFNLGILHVQGRGGRKDYVQAYKWFALSAQQNTKGATKLREAVAKKLTPEQLAEAKRLVAEWKRKNAKTDGAAGN